MKQCQIQYIKIITKNPPLRNTVFYIAIYLSLGLHKGCPCPSYRRSPQKRTSSTSKHEIS
jgi:hypothetical protein